VFGVEPYDDSAVAAVTAFVDGGECGGFAGVGSGSGGGGRRLTADGSIGGAVGTAAAAAPTSGGSAHALIIW
jgi:hypothetical protein